MMIQAIQNKIGLNGNILKILACIFMLMDHMGYILWPEIEWLRWVGRLAFPIFAFFIAEGCKYTRNKYRYFGVILCLGLIMALIQYLATNELYINIFLTFSVSILLVYFLHYIKKIIFENSTPKMSVAYFAILLALAIIVTLFVDSIVNFDYGFWGILVPVFFSIPNTRGINVPESIIKFDNLYSKLLFGLIGLIILSIGNSMSYQWICLFALVLLSLYNGERGKINIKYFFYIFYPAHIALLYLIKMVM